MAGKQRQSQDALFITPELMVWTMQFSICNFSYSDICEIFLLQAVQHTALKSMPFKIISEFKRLPVKVLIIAASELSGQGKSSGTYI
jgi:hypothetical protein